MSTVSLDSVLTWIADALDRTHQTLFEQCIQPVLYALGWMRLSEPLFDLSIWIVVGALEVAALALILGAPERRWPAEPASDRPAVRPDVTLSLKHI